MSKKTLCSYNTVWEKEIKKIADTDEEVTFIICYVIPEKEFQYTRREQNELESKAPFLTLCRLHLKNIIYPFLLLSVKPQIFSSYYKIILIFQPSANSLHKEMKRDTKVTQVFSCQVWKQEVCFCDHMRVSSVSILGKWNQSPMFQYISLPITSK
jgi:hypothetical protein